MRNTFYIISLLLFSYSISNSQSIGDTIKVQSFDYSSHTRDTIVSFPTDTSIKYEKIWMLYNMRCKGARVSTGSARNLGCGEWDYSCNTYIHDSTSIDSILVKRPKYQVTNVTPTAGNTYHYTLNPVYDYYRHFLKRVTLNSIITESKDTIINGNDSLSTIFDNSNKSGKSQFIYTASELLSAGFTAGNINGIQLEALSPGSVDLLRVRIKGDTSTQLNNKTPILTGFTETYFNNYTFVTGLNRIQFHTPFNWNGTDNLIIEFSYTNSSLSTTNIKLKADLASNQGMYANNGYHINLGSSNNYKVISSVLTSIQNELTVSFWAYGDNGLSSKNTSILEGKNSLNSRELNLHLPWSNGSVYFDCGTANSGSYDRINKSSISSNLEGKWNHWSFTKNAVTGEMKIYLNGALWHSGNGKTKTINFAELMIGRALNGKYVFFGKIDEIRIWKSELSQTEIMNWMNLSINNTHPDYSDLVSYYKVGKESLNKLVDSSVNLVDANGLGIDSTRLFERGVKISRFFEYTSNKPNLVLLKGTYNMSVTNVQHMDSIRKTALTLSEHSLTKHPGTLLSDEYNTVQIQQIYSLSPSVVYDAKTDTVITTIPVTATDSVTFSDLDSYTRRPTKFEIMSFVTPYGINLDLGPTGKTWIFDVTDFTPFLKGDKRITMERGGQWQEEMDISFLFVVGTPERDVLDIKEVWPVNSRKYTDIIANKYFAPRKVPLLLDGKYFEVKTAITGHGQEGEFIPRNHFLKVGASQQFTWQVWKTCGENPVYPQGGTWIYDRAGWCPGMATDIRNNDITTYVTAGDSAVLDYGVTTASGTSNYIVSNKLVTYGEYNHNLDAALVDVVAPSNRVEYTRENNICHYPKVTIKNAGKTTLTSLKIEFWVNNNSTKEVYNWTGTLLPSEQEVVQMSAPSSLWSVVVGTDNEFHVEISNPNGGTDEYSHNNSYTADFKIPAFVPSKFRIDYRSNSAANETSFKIYNEFGTVIHSNSGQANNTLSRDTLTLGLGCYRLVVEDTDGDGIGFWANSDGTGYLRFHKMTGQAVMAIQPDFGSSFVYNFTVGSPLSLATIQQNNAVSLYPNPSQGTFSLEGKNLQEATITLINSLGQKVNYTKTVRENEISIETDHLSPGIYTVLINYKEGMISKRLVIK